MRPCGPPRRRQPNPPLAFRRLIGEADYCAFAAASRPIRMISSPDDWFFADRHAYVEGHPRSRVTNHVAESV